MKKFDKYFLLTWRKLWIVVVAGFVSMILHNLISGIFNFEEPVFFILVVIIIPVYFLICLVYSLIKILKMRQG